MKSKSWEYMMCGDTRTIRIIPSESQLEWARDYVSKDFKYQSSRFNGTPAERFAGMVGERCFGDHYNVPVREHEDTESVGHDIIIGNFRIDAKTTRCIRRPEFDFKVAVRKDHMENKCDLFGLSFYNAPTNILTICGWATKPRMRSHGQFQDQGEKDARSAGCGEPWAAKHPTWKIQVRYMYKLEDLEKFCDERVPGDIPEWDRLHNDI